MIVKFYQDLIENFPPETVLKTLVRILSVAKEKKLREAIKVEKNLNKCKFKRQNKCHFPFTLRM